MQNALMQLFRTLGFIPLLFLLQSALASEGPQCADLFRRVTIGSPTLRFNLPDDAANLPPATFSALNKIAKFVERLNNEALAHDDATLEAESLLAGVSSDLRSELEPFLLQAIELKFNPPDLTDVLLTHFDGVRADAERVQHDLMEKMRPLIALLKDPYPPTYDEMAVKLADAVSGLSFEMKETFFDFFDLILRFTYGDATRFNGLVESLIAEERFDEWVKVVTKFQRASLESTAPARPMPLTPSAQEFARKMGLVPLAEARALFSSDMPWISPESLASHFDKRVNADKMIFTSPQDMIFVANQFLHSESPAQMVFRRNNKIIVKYDADTHEMAVLNINRKIITYFLITDAYRKGRDPNVFLYHLLVKPPSS